MDTVIRRGMARDEIFAMLETHAVNRSTNDEDAGKLYRLCLYLPKGSALRILYEGAKDTFSQDAFRRCCGVREHTVGETAIANNWPSLPFIVVNA